MRFLTEKLPNIHILLTTSKTCTDKLQHNTRGGWGSTNASVGAIQKGLSIRPGLLSVGGDGPQLRYDELGILALIDRDADAPQFFSPSLPFPNPSPKLV